MKPKFNIIFYSLLALLFLTNLSLILIKPSPYAHARLLMLSPSKGDRYFGRLLLWQTFVKAERWPQAQLLESQLNSTDLAYYQSIYYPQNLKKQLNQLTVKSKKSIEDYVKIAQIEQKLNSPADALSSMMKARDFDPIRPDLSAIFSQLQAQPL